MYLKFGTNFSSSLKNAAIQSFDTLKLCYLFNNCLLRKNKIDKLEKNKCMEKYLQLLKNEERMFGQF